MKSNLFAIAGALMLSAAIAPSALCDEPQKFLVDKSSAKTFVNPLPLDYARTMSRNKGVVSENPFAMHIDVSSSPTHARFQPLFNGTVSYISENDSRASADPSGMYYKDTWYLYGTNGSLWVSKDFSEWRFVQLKTDDGRDMNFTAPTIAHRTDDSGREHFYLAWNSSHIYESLSPEGPFKDLGDFTYNGKSFQENTREGKIIADHNDVNIFVDDDRRMYLYWGMGPYISGAELDVNNPTRLITEPKIIIEYDNRYPWQNFGQHHQDYENGFPEGSWMLKYKGKYYLTWTTAGTQYDSYTMGCYQSTRGPLDGFSLQEKEIIPQADAMSGTVRGGGHGSIVEGPAGTLWCFYTVNVGYEGDMERRLGCDPAKIDAEGNLVVPHLSEVPQYAPGVLSNPADCNETGDDILSARQGYAVSSYIEGWNPVYAIDESILTWWRPALDDAKPWYVVPFKGNYNVDAFRIIWKELNADKNSMLTEKCAIDYIIEVCDGNPGSADEWVKVYERKGKTEIIDYVKLDKSIKCQFARVTITGWPKEITPGLVEFTVYGRSVAKP